MTALGDAADLAASLAAQEDTGLPPAAAGWHRKLMQRDAEERFELLHEWSLPTQSRRLTGDFDVQCNAPAYAMHSTGLMFGGVFQQFVYDLSFNEGTLRSKQQMNIAPPLTQLGETVRMRIRVRDGVCTTFFNGREMSSRELPKHYEPWLAVYSEGCDLSGVRDLRIAGDPMVPKAVELAPDGQLFGWLPYFDERVGTEGDGAPWRYREDGAGGWIVGVTEPAIAGSFKESLLQYHRPIAEDGVIEYEFYYEPGQTVAHPALDRLAFLLDPSGVKIHWVTDGAYAAANSDPTNQTVEPEHRRGGEALPLRPNDWNRMAIALRGDHVDLTLNGQLIYRRPLEVTNQRTFGLFHFADQTEVRVRRVVLRGDWPKALPSASEQELADKALSSVDESQAKLPAVFSHSFVDGGFPSKYFSTAPSGPTQQFALRADGALASVTARGPWVSLTILPRFAVQGDFDIEAAFDQLQLRGEQTEGILISTEHAGEQRPSYRMMRLQEQGNVERLHESLSLLHSDGGRSFSTPHFEPCESISGRLRLARRGETIYYLFADGDSTAFQLIGTQQGTAAETTPEGIQIQALGNGTSETKVVWKHVAIRAEKMTYFPPHDGPPTRRLIVMNADGSAMREVTGPPLGYTNLGSPEWSIDGQQIAFDVTPGNFSGTHMFVVNTAGTDVRDRGLGAMPSYSPDGRRIVFTQPGRGVMMMNADGSNRADVDASGWGAQWSPDGKWIAWGRGGNIFVMNAMTKQQKPLLVGEQATLFNYTYWNLGWSHDSRSIAFKAHNQQTGGEDIVVADINSPRGFKILLASSQGVHPDFSFSPDNRRILFAMHNPAHKGPQLYTLDRDKDGPPQLLPGQPLDWMIYNGDWSPDGKQIAFTGEQFPQPVDWPIADKSAAEKQ